MYVCMRAVFLSTQDPAVMTQKIADLSKSDDPEIQVCLPTYLPTYLPYIHIRHLPAVGPHSAEPRTCHSYPSIPIAYLCIYVCMYVCMYV